MTATATQTLDLDPLRTALDGRVVAPGDPDYDAMRTVVAGDVDRRPAAIARVAGASDVAAAIAFAREHDLEIAVRSGGHSGAGHGATEGGLVIDVRDMSPVRIDPAARTATAETGATAAHVTAAAGAHGLAVGFGDTGSVGIGGITLGGGIGYLVRKHGLTIDSLLGAEIVTADGEILEVDDDHHPDLFWAIRGGGGNFGVATRFVYRLHPVADVVGGMLVLPATADSVAGFIAACEAAPEELSAIANVMNCPPIPGIPEEHHGTLVNMAFLCFAGDVEAGERAMAPFRALATPLLDDVKPIAYPQMYPDEEGGGDYRPTAVAHTMFVDHVGVDEARTILDALAASDSPMRAVQLRVLGGAVARVAVEATAFAHRRSRIMAVVVAFYQGAEDCARRAAWVRDLATALHQGDDGAYVNFLGADDPPRVRAAYPGPTWDRLVEIKRRYDPTNLFRLNHNIDAQV